MRTASVFDYFNFVFNGFSLLDHYVFFGNSAAFDHDALFLKIKNYCYQDRTKQMNHL